MPDLIQLTGTDILYRRWHAEGTKAVLILVHGLGAHTARWNFLSDFFADKEYSSYAIELKGFGQTPDLPRGHIESFNIYYQDIVKLAEAAKKENPGKKLFLLAESMGGLIAFNLACMHPELFAGQILISPAFANGMKFPLSAYLTLAAFILIDPKRTVQVPFTAAMCTRDKDYENVMNNNPDEYRNASLKLLMETLLSQLKSGGLMKKLALPTLFLIPGKDYLVDENAGRKIFGKLPVKDKTKIEYPEMLHALSIDLGREKVFSDVLQWIEKRL